MNLEEALRILEFEDVQVVPKIKDIQKHFHRLSKIKHPDKNNGSKESTLEFQNLLNAYHVAGKAAEKVKPEEDDVEDIIARKVFEQFQFSSVKVNSQSITIKTEKDLNSTWMEILSTNLGQPIDNKGTHGKKFTLVDKCEEPSTNIFLTLYHTGNLLVQAQGNKQSINIHFMDIHLQDLFMQVYNRAKLQNKISTVSQPYKTPLRKIMKTTRGVKRRIKCPQCEYQTNDTSHLAKHMKKHGAPTARILLDKFEEAEDPSATPEPMEAASLTVPNISGAQNTSVLPPESTVKAPAKMNSVVFKPSNESGKFHCMLCGEGFGHEHALNLHVKEAHEIPCTMCDLIFFDDLDKNVHMLSCHNSETEKPAPAEDISDSECSKIPQVGGDLCEEKLANKLELDSHIEDSHKERETVESVSVVPPTEVTRNLVLECEFCNFTTEAISDLNQHVMSHNKTWKCNLCEYTANTEFAYQLHVQSYHRSEEEECPTNVEFDNKLTADITGYEQAEPSVPPSLQCDICDFNTPTASVFANHVNTHVTTKKCDKCEFTANTEFAFQMHVHGHHPTPSACINFPCSTCGMTFGDIRELNDHVIRRHTVPEVPDNSKQEPDVKYYLKYIIEQNREIMEDIFEFKKTVKQHFNTIASDQERIHEEFSTMGLFSQKLEQEAKAKEEEHKTLMNKGFEALFSGMKVLESHQSHLSQQINDITNTDSPSNPDNEQDAPADKPHQQKKQQMRTCERCDFVVYSDLHIKKHMKIRHGVRDKMLWVADSISSNVDFKNIAEKTGLNIKPTKAYTVTKDTPGAKFPEKNFLDVVEKELSVKDYTFLVLGGGTIEITNLNTSITPEADLTGFKDEVIESSKKLFSLAECALETHPSLEKVILLRRPPMFDPVSTDPLELKPQLSRLGDSVFFELWCNSRFKKRIYLGDHQIPNRLDNEHNAVFGNPDQDHYDGLHMIGHAGRHVFQESILSILNGAGIFVIPEGRKANQERNIRDRPNTQDLEGRPLGRKTSDDKTIPTGTKPNLERGAGQYDPLQMFRERLSSSRKESCQPTDQISQQQKQNDGMFQADGNKSSRASVISSSSLQGNYSIPVSNPFHILGN